jgi:hypothetical protein
LYFQASRAHVLKAATEYIRNMKTKNQQHQKAIEELKRQNAANELQSNSRKNFNLYLFIFRSSS